MVQTCSGRVCVQEQSLVIHVTRGALTPAPCPGPFTSCTANEMIMIGDRYLTDVAFGNRHGMLTIRPEPFTVANELLAVRAVRGRGAMES